MLITFPGHRPGHLVPTRQPREAADTAPPTDDALSAILAASLAAQAVRQAVAAYQRAGFGSHVTDPLLDALALVEYSAREAQS